MALGPRLDLRQTQSLVMTPQLQQAIKLLQLSRAELVDVVTEELAENPLLEEGLDPKDERDEPVSDVVDDSMASDASPEQEVNRITSYNVCYTKLLRILLPM